jgi:ribulose-phosphate 3-epimerase
MTRIVPAILTADRSALLSQLSLVHQLTSRVQIDCIDNTFVDNATVPITDLPKPIDTKVDLDIMSLETPRVVEQAVSYGPQLIIVHFELVDDLTPIIARVKKAGIQMGLAIDPDTTIKQIKPFIDELSTVMVMGYPAGFAGQKFQPAVLQKVDEVRAINNDVEISLDGGVSLATIAKICDTNLDIAYVNSALFKSEDPLTSYSELMEKCGI